MPVAGPDARYERVVMVTVQPFWEVMDMRGEVVVTVLQVRV